MSRSSKDAKCQPRSVMAGGVQVVRGQGIGYGVTERGCGFGVAENGRPGWDCRPSYVVIGQGQRRGQAYRVASRSVGALCSGPPPPAAPQQHPGRFAHAGLHEVDTAEAIGR